MAKFCVWCGTQVEDDAVFCPSCGKRTDGMDAAATQPLSTQPLSAAQQQFQQQMGPAYGAPQGKKSTGLIIGIVAAVLALVIGVGGFVWPGFFRDKEEKPDTEDVSGKKDNDKSKEDKDDKNDDKDDKRDDKDDKKDEDDGKKNDDKPEDGGKPEEPSIEEKQLAEEKPPVEEKPYVNPFTDVKEGEWYYDALMWAGKNGIVGGTSFDPNGKTTRAQALTFLWRAAGSPEPNLPVSPYSDVTIDKYYYHPVLWGFEHGLISTAEDGKFHADNTLTRAQAITFLYRAVDGEDYDLEQTFSDVKPGDWYYDAANWAYGAGVVGRNDKFTFDGNSQITRAQFVTFMHRAFVYEANLWNQSNSKSASSAPSTSAVGGETFTTKSLYGGDSKTATITLKGMQNMSADERKAKDSGSGYSQSMHATLKRGQDAEFQIEPNPTLTMLFLFKGTEKLGSISSNDKAFSLSDKAHFTYSDLHKASVGTFGEQAFNDADRAVIVWAYQDLQINVHVKLVN